MKGHRLPVVPSSARYAQALAAGALTVEPAKTPEAKAGNLSAFIGTTEADALSRIGTPPTFLPRICPLARETARSTSIAQLNLASDPELLTVICQTLDSRFVSGLKAQLRRSSATGL